MLRQFTNSVFRYMYILNIANMKEKLEILEIRPYGIVVHNLTYKFRQLIPVEKFKKRLKWEFYEIINLAKFPSLLPI